MTRAKGKAQGNRFSRQLGDARKKETDSIYLYDSVKILTEWMQNDILSLAGPTLEERKELFEFVVQELQALEPLCSYRIQPVIRYLKNQKDDLLAFAGALDKKLKQVSKEFEVDQEIVREICLIQGISDPDKRWQHQAKIQNILKPKEVGVNFTTRFLSAVVALIIVGNSIVFAAKTTPVPFIYEGKLFDDSEFFIRVECWR